MEQKKLLKGLEDLEDLSLKLEDKAAKDKAFDSHLQATNTKIEEFVKKAAGMPEAQKGVKWRLASFLFEVEKLLGGEVPHLYTLFHKVLKMRAH